MLNGTFLLRPLLLLPKLRDYYGTGGRKNVRAIKWQEHYGKLSSGHYMVIALMNSQYLWLPAQDQTTQNSSKADRVHQAPPLTEERLQLMAAAGRIVVFLWRCGHAPGDNLTPMYR